MKDIFKFVISGFFFGVGLVVAFFTAYKSDVFNDRYDGGYLKEADKNLVESVKSVLADIEKTDIDNCSGIEGVWSGVREEEDDTKRTWNLDFSSDGKLSGVITFETPSSTNTDKQSGTWECKNSVLFTSVDKEEFNRSYKQNYVYIILSANENEKILSYVDIHKYPRTYLYKKQKP